MNSLERCLAAIKHKIPDRVPVIPQDSQFAAFFTGYDMVEFSKDPKKIANGQIECCKKFGFDGIMMGPDAVILAEAIGAEVELSETESPKYKGGCLDKLEDVEKLKIIDPWKDGRLHVWLEAVKLIVESVGNEVLVIGRGDQGAFSCAAEVRGIENFLLDIALGEKEDLIYKLLKYCYDCGIEFMKAMKSVGAHVTTIGDSLSGPAVVSPETYEKYSFPYEKNLSDELKRLNLGFSIHICGNTDAIMDKWVQTGADIFEIDHKTNFVEARKKTLGRICLLGNLDTSSVLLQGSPELVKEKARGVIDICMPHSGLILSSGCLVGRTTPHENMQALADSAKEFGVYKC